MSYAPLFSSIIHSSLWWEPATVRVLFITMLAMKDRRGIVPLTSAFMLADAAKITESEAQEALRILSSPDTRRKEEQPYEGRRIERVPEGWLVLNGGKYQEEMVRANRRAYQCAKQAEYRAKKRKQPQSGPTMEERLAMEMEEPR